MEVNLVRNLKEGYELVKKNKEVTWLSLIILLSAIPMNFLSLFGKSITWLSIATAIYIVLGTYFLGSIVRIYQKRRRRKNTLRRSILDMRNFFPILLITALIVGSLTYFGMIFLLVPGLLILTKLIFGPITVITEERGVIEALKKSWNLSKGHGIKIFLTVLTFFVIWWGISTIRFLPMIIGFDSTSMLISLLIYDVILLFFIPFSTAVIYSLYEEIKSKN